MCPGAGVPVLTAAGAKRLEFPSRGSASNNGAVGAVTSGPTLLPLVEEPAAKAVHSVGVPASPPAKDRVDGDGRVSPASGGSERGASTTQTVFVDGGSGKPIAVATMLNGTIEGVPEIEMGYNSPGFADSVQVNLLRGGRRPSRQRCGGKCK